MKYDDLKETVLNSEENCVKFLRSFGIFNEYTVTCPRVADSVRCNAPHVRKKRMDGLAGDAVEANVGRPIQFVRRMSSLLIVQDRENVAVTLSRPTLFVSRITTSRHPK